MKHDATREVRKAKALAVKKEFSSLGIRQDWIAEKVGWSESFLSRVFNEEEEDSVPSQEFLDCLDQLLHREILARLITKWEGPALSLVDACNGTMAELSTHTRSQMVDKLRRRLLGASARDVGDFGLPVGVEGAMFQLKEGPASTSMYIVLVRSTDEPDELATLAHELRDLGDRYEQKASQARASRSYGRTARPRPRSEF